MPAFGFSYCEISRHNRTTLAQALQGILWLFFTRREPHFCTSWMFVFSTLDKITSCFMVPDKQRVYRHAIEQIVAERPASSVTALNGHVFVLFNWWLEAHHVALILQVCSNSRLTLRLWIRLTKFGRILWTGISQLQCLSIYTRQPTETWNRYHTASVQGL